MKKGLSVLLIAAALFGFYGGAVNLNDVLACKDYWEKEDKKTTADLNKLEDGLNQLKENEEAYLDGLDQVKDGEEQLAQGEADLAKGESDYADGQKELAKGEADYAAAPGKLAAARTKIANGEAALAEGQDQLDSLKTLIGGINQVLDGYPTFRNGYSQLREGRVGAIKKPTDTSQLVAVLNAYYQNAGNTDAAKALQSLQAAGTSFAKQNAGSFTNEQYDGFKDYLEKTKAALDDANTFFDNLKKGHNSVASSFTSALNGAQPAAEAYSAVLTAAATAQAAQKKAEESGSPEDIAAAQAAGKTYQDTVEKYGTVENVTKALNAKLAVCEATAKEPQLAGAVQLATNVFIAAKKPEMVSTVTGALSLVQGGLTVRADGTNAEKVKSYLTAVGTIPVALATVNEGITDTQNTTVKEGKATADKWLDGYKQLNAAKTSSLKTLVGGVAQIVGGVLTSGNKELISGMNKAAKAQGFTPSNFTPAATSQLAKDLNSKSWMEDFYNDGNKVEKAFKSVLPSLNKKASDGAKTLAAGKKTLASGKKQYAQGLADYKAAPAKLAAGRKALAEGLQKLMDGRQQLADGRADLKAGKEKLAEYEDGEQQVRDGLATLMASEANGGLESILERRNGDDQFDDANGHLGLDEGLDAVGTGREYKADSGVLVTNEIMARAVGTGAGLGAAVLALLAALLGLLKKYKGAGVCAILTAVAAAVGTAYGMNAGTEFSNIAGSTVGTTPWIAFGVLAAVALIDSVVHFTAKKEA